MTGPRRFHCLIFRWNNRVWHWHWPRSGILTCPRSSLTAPDDNEQET